MAAPNLSLNTQTNSLTRCEVRPAVFGMLPAICSQGASLKPDSLRIAVIGNHLPRQCGIATFTTDLCDALATEYGASGLMVAAVNAPQSSYSYPARVRFQIGEGDKFSYRATADFLNSSHADLACLQHEFGIFGGKAGSYVLKLLQHLALPVVTTLHTVLRQPNPDQRSVMMEIAARSDRLVVMTEYSAHVLQDVFRVSREKIDLIPHGIPDLPFVEPDHFKGSLSLTGKTVLLTFGLLSANKGFENVIHALPRILARHKNAVYVIAGATHPQVRAREGDRYRYQLQALARQLGVEAAVIFHNRFFSPREMAALVGSADLYITPYCHEAQAVSGTLAYAMGAGKAIISTPYWHAAELLDEGRGALVPFESPAAIAEKVNELLDNDVARQAMRKRAYLYARKMVWNRAAQSYMSSFARACGHRVQPVDLAFPVRAVEGSVASRLTSA